MKHLRTIVFALLIVTGLLPILAQGATLPRPKLVLFVVVDQLRGDMHLRFEDRFGDGGFRRLLEEGVVYRNAHYRHANTFTAVGHATLATGGNTPQHGIAGNNWYDTTTGKVVYCVEDSSHPPVGTEDTDSGMSPKNLSASTFGDELVLATGGASRVFSVSMKDRAAVLLGGHRGKAFWYDPTSGNFVSSTHFYDAYPPWVNGFNAARGVDAWLGSAWSLLHPKGSYVFGGQDDRPEERAYKGLGRIFPHPLPVEAGKDYYGTLRFTPMADQLTLDFATTLLNVEKLGQGNHTDVLAVSLSATDYIGHAFGPNSLEAEDNLIQLDRSLALFFAKINDTIGLDRTLIVLSSDHGVDAIPEYTQHLGCEGGRHYPDRFFAAANGALRERFSVEEDLVVSFQNPSFYLDEGRVSALGLELPAVEKSLAQAIVALPGFDDAVTRSDLLAGSLPTTPLMDQVQRAFHPKRSGHVLVVQSKSWYLYPDAEKYAAMHGSPHSYDTYVPIMIAGPGIAPKHTHRAVAPEDVASTVTAYLGIKPPSGNTGTPLLEVTDHPRPIQR